MDLVKASQYKAQKNILKEALKLHQTGLHESLKQLVKQQGYSYAKSIASEISNEFLCKPGDPNFETYSTIAWTLNELFKRIESTATNPPKDDNANNKRKRAR